MEKPQTKIETPSAIRKVPTHMYEIPGHEQITDHVFERYTRDRAQNPEIERLSYRRSRVSYLREITDTEPEQRKSFILNYLNSQQYEDRKRIVEVLTADKDQLDLKPKDWAEIINNILESEDIYFIRDIASFIKEVPEGERGHLIEQVLDLGLHCALTKTNAAKNIDTAPENEQDGLRDKVAQEVEKVLSYQEETMTEGSMFIDTRSVQSNIINLIPYAPPDRQSSLLYQAIQLKDSQILHAVYESFFLHYPKPQTDRQQTKQILEKLINYGSNNNELMIRLSESFINEIDCDNIKTHGLIDNDIYLLRSGLQTQIQTQVSEGLEKAEEPAQRLELVEMIYYVRMDKKYNLLKNALTDPDPEVVSKAIEVYCQSEGYLPESKERLLEEQTRAQFETELASKDIDRLKKVIGLVVQYGAEKKEEVFNKIFEIAREASESQDPNKRLSVIELIEVFPKETEWGVYKVNLIERFNKKRFDLAEKLLSDQEPKVQIRALDIAKILDESEKEEFLSKIMENGLAQEMVKSPLYENPETQTGDFFQRDFEKDGSRTTLIGGGLKDRAIIRHIEPDAFLSWQRLYENHQLWQKAGFDYIPIEPILAYNFNSQQGLVEVYSGVLDLNMADWFERSGYVNYSELLQERQQIVNVLNSHGLEHGHNHLGNFALRFFRDENGQPDLNQKPRIYLIDFDQAVSPQF